MFAAIPRSLVGSIVETYEALQDARRSAHAISRIEVAKIWRPAGWLGPGANSVSNLTVGTLVTTSGLGPRLYLNSVPELTIHSTVEYWKGPLNTLYTCEMLSLTWCLQPSHGARDHFSFPQSDFDHGRDTLLCGEPIVDTVGNLRVHVVTPAHGSCHNRKLKQLARSRLLACRYVEPFVKRAIVMAPNE